MPVRPLNLCKIHPERFKTMGMQALLDAEAKQRGRNNRFSPAANNQAGVLLEGFLNRLIALHETSFGPWSRATRHIHRVQPAEMAKQKRWLAEAEERIHVAQAKAGCALGKELVARDAVLEKRYGEANRIRRTKRRAGLRKRR